MILQESQSVKAELFRKQHFSGKLLVLPNIWDSLGARLLEQVDYKSVATASVATALSNGYLDGEKIPFNQLLKVVHQITTAVSLPVTVDIERGFADSIVQLKENIRLLIENGAIGINIEDSHADHQGLFTIDEQCRKNSHYAPRQRHFRLSCTFRIHATSSTIEFRRSNAVSRVPSRRLQRETGLDFFRAAPALFIAL